MDRTEADGPGRNACSSSFRKHNAQETRENGIRKLYAVASKPAPIGAFIISIVLTYSFNASHESIIKAFRSTCGLNSA